MSDSRQLMSPKSVTLVAVGVADELGMMRAGIVANGEKDFFAESFGDYLEDIIASFFRLDKTAIFPISVYLASLSIAVLYFV